MSRAVSPNHDAYAKVMGRLLAAELRRAKMTPYRLAQLSGIHRSNLHHYLHGRDMPTPVTLILLAETIGIAVSRLLPKKGLKCPVSI